MSVVGVIRAKRARRAALVTAAIVGSAFAACGDDTAHPSPLLDGGGAFDATVGGDATLADAGGNADASSPKDAGHVDDGPPLGDVITIGDAREAGGASLGGYAVVDEPTSTCATRGGSLVEVYSATSGVGPLRSLAMVGTRRVAADFFGGGFVTFDADGANASASLVLLGSGHDAVASEGTTLGATARGQGAVLYARYDANGAAVGAPITLASEPSTTTDIASGGGTSLVVWTTSTDVRARGIASSGQPTASAFNVATLPASSAPATAVAYDAASSGFAIAWSNRVASSSTTLSFERATLAGPFGSEIAILSAPEDFAIVALRKTPSGWALLLNQFTLPASTYLVILSNAGSIVGALHRLDGADFGYDLAVQGAEIGVVANRPGAGVQFRSFDAAGHALGSWVCFDGGAQDPNVWATIDADGAGYAVLHRRPTSANALVRFDRLGTGP